MFSTVFAFCRDLFGLLVRTALAIVGVVAILFMAGTLVMCASTFFLRAFTFSFAAVPWPLVSLGSILIGVGWAVGLSTRQQTIHLGAGRLVHFMDRLLNPRRYYRVDQIWRLYYEERIKQFRRQPQPRPQPQINVDADADDRATAEESIGRRI
jgi:membrane protein implicated in regulation of membrane protease activity